MTPNETQLPLPFRAVRLVNVCQMLNASPSTIWRWVKTNPSFPKPIKLSPSVTAWDEAELLAWVQARKSERHHENAPTSDGDL